MKDMTHETRHHRPGLFRPDLSSTLNSLPGSSHPRYQPSTKLRYKSKKMVRVMVRVAPHKTPVVIGLVRWYCYFPRAPPPHPGPFSQPSTFDSQLPLT